MNSAKTLQQPLGLRLTSAGFLAFWCLLAAFPIFWIAVMSVKVPVDAFSSNPLHVIFGPQTLADGHGLSLIDIVLGLVVLWLSVRFAFTRLPQMVSRFSQPGTVLLGWVIAILGYALILILVFFVLLPFVLSGLNAVAGPLGHPIIGMTTEHYTAVWVENEFYRNFINSMIVTGGVVTISLTVGTLAGYGLARSGSDLAFWLLIIALVFRALPHSVLVAGYLPVFINSAEFCGRFWGMPRQRCMASPSRSSRFWLRSTSHSRSGCCGHFSTISRPSWTRRPASTAVPIFRPFAGSSCR